MFNYHNYVYKKEVDWSVLHQGVSIPVTIQVIFQRNIENFPKRGESKDIFLVLEGKSYKAELKNQKFNEYKYPNHKDILQIRYNTQSDIAEALRKNFTASYNYLLIQRNLIQGNKKKFVKIPDESHETLAIYTTEYEDTYYLECITKSDMSYLRDILKVEDEVIYEDTVNYATFDHNAKIDISMQMSKVRHLNRAIGDNLKLLYDYRCQICNENFSAKYDTEIVESHHIDPFVKSLNNDAANILILCPNHHRVIHKAEPVFKKKSLIYLFKNGIEERVMLNRHL